MLIKIGTKDKPLRLAFPNIFTAKSVNGGDPRYGASFLLDPKHPSVKEIEKTMLDVAVAKWADKGEKILKNLKAEAKVCLRDGDLKSQFDGYEGNLYISAGSTPDKRPSVFDRDKSPLTQADGKPYAGCYVIAGLDIWAQDNVNGKRINATLRWVQFVKDGDAFGAGGSPVDENEIDDLSDGTDDDDIA